MVCDWRRPPQWPTISQHIAASPWHRFQMPAYHLVARDGQGTSLVNIGVGPERLEADAHELVDVAVVVGEQDPGLDLAPVGPGIVAASPWHRFQMPAYHLVARDGQGTSLVNIGVGPSNALDRDAAGQDQAGVALRLGDERLEADAHELVDVAEPQPVGDEIADGLWLDTDDEARPLALFDGPRVDYPRPRPRRRRAGPGGRSAPARRRAP
jgi:hypothetical protein